MQRNDLTASGAAVADARLLLANVCGAVSFFRLAEGRSVLLFFSTTCQVNVLAHVTFALHENAQTWMHGQISLKNNCPKCRAAASGEAETADAALLLWPSNLL